AWPGDIDNIKVSIAMITDGTSNTIMIGETLVDQRYDIRLFATTWTNEGYVTGWAAENNGYVHDTTVIPINYKTDLFDDSEGQWCTQPERNQVNWGVSWGFKSNHLGGVNFAFCDGSVHFISQNIEHRTYQLLGARNDGQTVTLP